MGHIQALPCCAVNIVFLEHRDLISNTHNRNSAFGICEQGPRHRITFNNTAGPSQASSRNPVSWSVMYIATLCYFLLFGGHTNKKQ